MRMTIRIGLISPFTLFTLRTLFNTYSLQGVSRRNYLELQKLTLVRVNM